MRRRIFLLLLISLSFAGSAAAQAVRYQSRVATLAEFDKLSRTYDEGRFYALPHLMFVIDRTSAPSTAGRVYFINSKLYSFHKEFLNANYLTLERGREFFRNNYLKPDRRFILGTIARQTRAGKFTFEFQEGDQITDKILREAYESLKEDFFAPLYFKPNSPQQEGVSAALADVPRLVAEDLNPPQDYLPLNQARSIGVLRIIDRLTDETILDRNEIVIFRESPISLTPISGVITTNFSIPLAHANLLARNWGIPNAYIRDAAETFKPLEGKFVHFETRADGFTLRPAEPGESMDYAKRMAERADLLTPPADLAFRAMTELSNQRKRDASRFGAKSANLGEVIHAARAGRLTGVIIPRGFTIPFYHYVKFLEANGLDVAIVEMLGNDRFNHDPAYRKERLAGLREMIEKGELAPDFARTVIDRKRSLLGGKGVFVRSSTNSEDLPDFSGAGLYTTVPNVRGDRALLDAIKTVWASLWNYEAYEARESFGINHAAVYPAVLIQEGMNANAAGVLITANPFDKSDRDAVYVNAKLGLGIRVVEGRNIPEQLIYHPKTGALNVLTRSGDDTMLTFDEDGGVREVKIEKDRMVLTDSIVRSLVRAALQIEKAFGGRDQDIEWLTIGNRIYIVQARPFVTVNY